jgi:hypothetical protein
MKVFLVIAAAVIGLAGCGSSSPPGSPQDLCDTLHKSDSVATAEHWATQRLAQGDSREKVLGTMENAKDDVCPDMFHVK